MTTNLKTLDPLARRLLAMQLIESLMAETDDAYEAFQPAFDALDNPATVAVFDPPEPDAHRSYMASMEMRSAELGYRLEKVA